MTAGPVHVMLERPLTCQRPGCAAPLAQPLVGRVRRYCSATCRVAAHDQARRAAAYDTWLEQELKAFKRRRRALLSSDSVEWYTPLSLFGPLAAELGPFDLDPAADPRAPVWDHIPRRYTAADDGLAQPWSGKVWCNPPYGTAVPRWIAKAVAELAAGRVSLVVMLVPARPDTGWWAAALAAGAEVRFVRGRLRFLEPGPEGDVRERTSAPFPSAILVFRGARG